MRVTKNGKRYYVYYPIDSQTYDSANLVTFTTKLIKYATIGTVISAEVEGSSYSKIQRSDIKIHQNHTAWDMITEWSVDERNALEELKAIQAAKKEHPQSVNSLIEKVYYETRHRSRQDRARIALYIYNQLMSD